MLTYYVFTERSYFWRSPMIFLHKRRDGRVLPLSSGARWVAVDLDETYICVSLYLPQPVHDFSVFRETLKELEVFLAKYMSLRRVLIGLDANSRMGYFDDDIHVGGSTIRSAPEGKKQ